MRVIMRGFVDLCDLACCVFAACVRRDCFNNSGYETMVGLSCVLGFWDQPKQYIWMIFVSCCYLCFPFLDIL